MEISADTNTLAVSTGCDSRAIVRACRVTRLYFVRDAPGPYRVYAPPPIQVFPGFTTASICPRSQTGINRAIQNCFTFVEVALHQVCKIWGKR